jgi:uncharacterized BrkB/YihY/UPF0761 family membrane protein
MTYEGHTAGTPRAGIVRHATVLTAHLTAWALTILAVLGSTVSLLGDPPQTIGALEGVLRNQVLAATLLATGLAGTALFSFGYTRAFRHATGAAVPFRGMRPSQVAAAIAWCVAIAGFVAYLASTNSFRDTYGSVSTGVVLLMLLTLFSLLHYAMPDLHVPDVGGGATPAAAVAWLATSGGLAVWIATIDSIRSSYWMLGAVAALCAGLLASHLALLRHVRVTPAEPRRSPIADRIDLVVAPSAALRNSTAQGHMMSVLGPRAAGLSDREVEMMDWGFAFGVAWAVAREQDPAAPDELVSLRALDVTQAVYDAYRGSPAPAHALES